MRKLRAQDVHLAVRLAEVVQRHAGRTDKPSEQDSKQPRCRATSSHWLRPAWQLPAGAIHCHALAWELLPELELWTKDPVEGLGITYINSEKASAQSATRQPGFLTKSC